MRISPICASLHAQAKNQLNKQQHITAPSFQGRGGAIGTLIGGAVGVTLAVASGGMLLPAAPVISGLAGIAGDIIETNSSGHSSNDDYNYSYDEYNSFDFIG